VADKKKQPQRSTGKTYQRLSTDDLFPIDKLIPHNRRFLGIGKDGTIDGEAKSRGLVGKISSSVKGFISGLHGKEMERSDVIKLRALIGNLKDTKVAASAVSSPSLTLNTNASSCPKSKKELLAQKRKNISQKSKSGKKKQDKIGLRIEIERLKKKYPNDGNLVILDAILTTRDSCLPHRSIEERVSSLSAVLKESGRLVAQNFLTTYSVDTLFDIYFLYLEALKKLFLERIRKYSEIGSRKSKVAVKSFKRDAQILTILLNQIKIKKTVANVAKKLNGFGYPYETMSNMDVAKTFTAEKGSENEKLGPGTVKLNKFLIRIYLNVFSPIPIFQPISSRICEVLPSDYQSKVIIANVNMDNAYVQLKISKAIKADTIEKQSLALFQYGKLFVQSTIKKNANTPAEGRILLRTAEMAEEYSFMSKKTDPEILKFGHECATMSLSFFQPEAENIVRRIFELADAKKVDLR